MDNEENNTVEENTITNDINEIKLEDQSINTENNIVEKEEHQTRLEKNEGNGNNKKGKKKTLLIVVITLLLISILVAIFVPPFLKHEKKEEGEVTKPLKASDYRMKGNSLEDFDLFFLKEENKEENIVYSPLSIKYALAMLADASEGDSKEQITNVIGDYKSKKYTNSKHLSLANAFFIKNSFKENVKQEYKDLVTKKYGAEVVYDEFKSAKPMNDWISNKTLGLLKDMLQDSDVKDLDFALINALAIDMDWNEIFILHPTAGVSTDYRFEYNEDFYWMHAAANVSSIKFSNTQEITGMEVIASFNNYDIIKELGEETIRKTVGDAYRKWLKIDENAEYTRNNPIVWKNPKTGKEENLDIDNEEDFEAYLEDYLDEYIKKISKAYGKEDKTTEFELYTDSDVKVFAKDLKEYDGTTLQYVGIMPINEELNTFVKNISAKQIQKYIDRLKPLKKESFKDGVVTKIEGYIPKFKYNYDLKLKEDLESLGIKNVFDSEKADLTGLTDNKSAYISVAKHSANIEFTELGIKASAATMFGGLGAAFGGFYYFYEVPVEIIDMTFDHPYMYIIRDKDTGEVWFAGTVYNPTLWKDEVNKDGPNHNYINEKYNS